jgi:ketosteroid isomerase-like protein
MNVLRLFGILFVSVTTVLAQQSGDADKNELTRLETAWNDAHMKGDAAVLAQLWEDSLVVTVPGMAPMNKTDSLAVWRSGQFKFDKYQTSEVDIRIYGDAAVVTGRLLRTRTFNGRTADDNWRFTKMYIKQRGQWKVVAYHASPVAL